MAAQGLPCSIAGVAQAYEDFLDVLICDTRDARAAETLRKNGLRVQCTQTIMRSADDKAGLAREVLSFVHSVPRAGNQPIHHGAAASAIWTPSRDSRSHQEHVLGETAPRGRSRPAFACRFGAGNDLRRAQRPAQLEWPPAGCSRHERLLMR